MSRRASGSPPASPRARPGSGAPAPAGTRRRPRSRRSRSPARAAARRSCPGCPSSSRRRAGTRRTGSGPSPAGRNVRTSTSPPGPGTRTSRTSATGSPAPHSSALSASVRGARLLDRDLVRRRPRRRRSSRPGSPGSRDAARRAATAALCQRSTPCGSDAGSSAAERWPGSFSTAPGGGGTSPSSSGSAVSRIHASRRPCISASTPACAASPARFWASNGIEQQVVQRLARQRPVGPAVRDEQVLGRAVVDVGEHREIAVAEAADVLPPLRPDRPLRLVRGVVGELGEDRVVDLVGLAPHHRQHRAALEEVRPSIPISSQIVG